MPQSRSRRTLGAVTPADFERLAGLRKMQAIALGLLAFMAVVFVVSFALQDRVPWLGYVRAASEGGATRLVEADLPEEVDVREAPVELAEQLGRGRGPSLDHEADGLGDHRRPVAALDLDRDERGELGAGGLAVE